MKIVLKTQWSSADSASFQPQENAVQSDGLVLSPIKHQPSQRGENNPPNLSFEHSTRHEKVVSSSSRFEPPSRSNLPPSSLLEDDHLNLPDPPPIAYSPMRPYNVAEKIRSVVRSPRPRRGSGSVSPGPRARRGSGSVSPNPRTRRGSGESGDLGDQKVLETQMQRYVDLRSQKLLEKVTAYVDQQVEKVTTYVDLQASSLKAEIDERVFELGMKLDKALLLSSEGQKVSHSKPANADAAAGGGQASLFYSDGPPHTKISHLSSLLEMAEQHPPKPHREPSFDEVLTNHSGSNFITPGNPFTQQEDKFISSRKPDLSPTRIPLPNTTGPSGAGLPKLSPRKHPPVSVSAADILKKYSRLFPNGDTPKTNERITAASPAAKTSTFSLLHESFGSRSPAKYPAPTPSLTALMRPTQSSARRTDPARTDSAGKKGTPRGSGVRGATPRGGGVRGAGPREGTPRLNKTVNGLGQDLEFLRMCRYD